MSWLKERLTEKSTWESIGAVVGGLGWVWLSPDVVIAFGGLVIAAFGLWGAVTEG